MDDDVDTLAAALAYAANGWFLVPVRRGSKNPGSVVGEGWQHRSSRDPQVLASWFAGTDHGIALHAGRSGAVIFDVDHPDALPEALAQELHEVPFQSTRAAEPLRGHYPFLVPPGRRLGNGAGRLGSAWGEVRGLNGVIVVAPSEHSTPGGHYRWKRTGPVPTLPASLAALLPDAGDTADAAPDAVVEMFLDLHVGEARPGLLTAVMEAFTADVARGGSRHDAAVRAACWAAREAQAGLYLARRAHDTLREAFLAVIGTDRDAAREWSGVWAWAVGQAALSDPAGVRAEVEARLGTTSAGAALADPAVVAGFWDERPVLGHVRAFARARMCSPWAVLGVLLARVTSVVDPHVVLPPIVGSYASLNTFVALVGPSGAGKGAAEAAAQDAVDVGGLEVATLGSGEGIAHLFAHREKGEVARDRWRVLATAPEVDTLTALAGRQGATLLPQLRSAWSGERQGFSYADPAKRLPIPRHEYRLGLVLGVQPGRAGPLLDDTDGGTPQRFVWLPTTDPDAPDHTPDEPQQWPVRWPALPPSSRGLHALAVPDVAVTAIRGARLARLRGEGDALDGHALLCRLKTAAALALLDGRTAVNADDWRLAGTVMAVSDGTRARVAAHLAEHATAANLARGRAEGARTAVAAEVADDHAAQRVARRLLALLAQHGEQTSSELRRRLPGRDRPHYEDALARLSAAGQLSVTGTDHGKRLARAGSAS